MKRVEPHPHIEGAWTITGGAEGARLPLYATRARALNALAIESLDGVSLLADEMGLGRTKAEDLADWAKTKLDPWEANGE